MTRSFPSITITWIWTSRSRSTRLPTSPAQPYGPPRLGLFMHKRIALLTPAGYVDLMALRWVDHESRTAERVDLAVLHM
ncbi:hypothetical protein PG997_001535 [Apiospora hydei]|uniref:Uncharacterized protein n=1 Tax=Apiospora hydei TaxID=1337664 RepID=A0ABR1XDT9_9PEZI